MTVEKTKREIDGVSVEVLRIQTEKNRFIEAHKLDMADQWDVMEMIGNKDPGRGWIAIALLAASIISIDGRPVDPGELSREKLRKILRDLGEDGVDAAREALSGDTEVTEEAHRAQVGNS